MADGFQFWGDSLMWRRLNLFIVCLLTCNVAVSIQAHNGYIAVAQPIEGVLIDGDLSDWPREMPYNFLSENRFVYRTARSTDSFRGKFRVGHNPIENALYLAVEVEDDKIVLDAAVDSWNTRDSCEIFLIPNHTSEAALPRQFVYRAKPIAVFQGKLDDNLARHAQVARISKEHQIIYEWRIDLNQLGQGPDDLSRGAVFGFDVCCFDCDGENDGQDAYYSSSPGSHKHENTKVLGDLVIAPAEGKVVELSGRVTWNQNIPPANHIQLRSITNEAIGFDLPTMRNGHFIIPVPSGEYELTASGTRPFAISSMAKRLTVTNSTAFTPPIVLEVKREEFDPENLSSASVYYDLAHGEQPLAKLREFCNRIGYSLRTSTEQISLRTLRDTKLLYLRAPTLRFLPSEKEAIAGFVEQGGSMLLVMDESRRTSVEKTEVNELLQHFGIKIGDDTEYVHNCGAIAKTGPIHQRDLELPFNGGRVVEGGTLFGFQLNKQGQPSHAFATYWEGPMGGRVVVLAEGMASLFLGSLDGQRLSGDSNQIAETTFWGKDSTQFNTDLFTWLLEDRGA